MLSSVMPFYPKRTILSWACFMMHAAAVQYMLGFTYTVCVIHCSPIMIQNLFKNSKVYIGKPPPLLCKCFLVLSKSWSTRTEEMLRWRHQAGLEPSPGGQHCVYIYCIYRVLATCYCLFGFNQQSAVLLPGWLKRKKKKKEALWNIFKSSVSLRAKACRLGSKGKKLHFSSSWGAGNSKVKGQQRGSLIKKEKGGRAAVEWGRLIDCFLSVYQSALSIFSSLSTAWLLCPLLCLKWLFIRNYVAKAIYTI